MNRYRLRLLSAVLAAALCVIQASCGPSTENSESKPKALPNASNALPKLVDLGATQCIPCKMMAPILEELKKEYKGSLTVVFIDVRQDRKAAEKYSVQRIPTQIFYDAKGKEFSRHVGFYSKEDILKAFKDNGIKLVRAEDAVGKPGAKQ